MTDASKFAHAISLDENLTEVDLAIRATWFLKNLETGSDVTIQNAVHFLSEWSIRPNINLARLKGKLQKDRRVSFRADGIIHIPLKEAKVLNELYGAFLAPQKPEIEDTVLNFSDFQLSRRYIKEIVWQINAAHQFGIFDGCAVLMRRLAEILIIDAYSARGEDGHIRDTDGNLKMMNGLINALKSGRSFKLSRNTPQYLEDLKTIGDNAAHSRNYITKKRDIDDFSQKFRMLIEDLRNLV